MATYYLIVGDRVQEEITRGQGAVTALPLLDEMRAVSLLNRRHVLALMNRFGLTAAEILAALGLVDERPERP